MVMMVVMLVDVAVRRGGVVGRHWVCVRRRVGSVRMRVACLTDDCLRRWLTSGVSRRRWLQDAANDDGTLRRG